jgi:hypothetical protein
LLFVSQRIDGSQQTCIVVRRLQALATEAHPPVEADRATDLWIEHAKLRAGAALPGHVPGRSPLMIRSASGQGGAAQFTQSPRLGVFGAQEDGSVETEALEGVMERLRGI